MSNRRTVTVFESAVDLNVLKTSKYNFNIAKAVINASGEKKFNVMWQSKALAPNISIAWPAVYGLNWTNDMPSEGLSVTASGEWMPVNKDMAYTLRDDGYMEQAQDQSGVKSGFIKVVNNYSGTNGVHFVVGVQNSSGGFDPVFVDPNQTLSNGGNGQYQPQESIRVWYGTGTASATMISENQTNSQDMDVSTPGASGYAWWVTYKTDSNRWFPSDKKPAPSLSAPPKGKRTLRGLTNGETDTDFMNDREYDQGVNALAGPLFDYHVVQFASQVATAASRVLIEFIRSELGKLYVVGDIGFSDGGLTLSITLKRRAGLIGDEFDQAIRAALKSAVAQGKLSSGQTWTIQ